jgi:hypothetical protein
MVLAAFIISIIAVVVALVAIPPFIQMYYGQPRLKVVFDNLVGYWIYCKIQNIPIRSILLRMLRVKRDSVKISVEMGLIDINTGKILHFDCVSNKKKRRLLWYDDISSNHIVIPAAEWSASTRMLIRTIDKVVYFTDENYKLKRRLKKGEYILELVVYTDSGWSEYKQNFRINKEEPFVELI